MLEILFRRFRYAGSYAVSSSFKFGSFIQIFIKLSQAFAYWKNQIIYFSQKTVF